MQLAMIGLGRMGGNMAKRIAAAGHEVVGYDRSPESDRTVASLEEMVAALTAPRIVWVMVPAGEATDSTINELAELLEPGDMIIDGGNSRYTDDARHAAELEPRGIHFMDCGVSGGVWGIDRGYALMVGGSEEDFERARPIFEALKPEGDSGLVLAGPVGGVFYYDSWKNEPIIRIKSNEARKLLEIEGNYARLKDYISTINEYKLEKMMNHIRSGEQVTDKRGIEEADEKFNIINLVCTGAMMKIFPCRNIAGKTLEWYSQSDQLPQDMDNDKWVFIRKSMSYVNEMIVMKKYNDACLLLEKIKKYQQKECDGLLPADNKFKAEKIYNQFDYSKSVAMACICIGLICFIYYCHCMASQKRTSRKAIIILNILLWIVFTYLSAAICLRGYVSNHLPLSNGFETMQFMAWCTLLLTFLLQRKFAMLLPFGFLLCGLTLMVSMLGESNPQITQLMPVLQSPLLSIHVVVIMIAYSLLAFIMLNGVTAVILHQSQKECKEQIERLQIISQIILYPAIFLLAIGIFIGAVWANVSWGRYWGWDPKEVWALITMLVYALALHPRSLPWFHRTMFFHVFCITAFITVLITYFGVNFLLGGMHSYANG